MAVLYHLTHNHMAVIKHPISANSLHIVEYINQFPNIKHRSCAIYIYIQYAIYSLYINVQSSSQCLQAFHTRWSSHKKRHLQLGMWVDISFAEVVVDVCGISTVNVVRKKGSSAIYPCYPKQSIHAPHLGANSVTQ